MALYPSTTTSLTDLTAAGTTNSVQVSSQTFTFQVTVSSIGTNVVLRFEGSLTNQDWFNLDSSEADTTITADGTTGYAVSDTPVEFVRVRLVSLSGGTPTVATTIGAA